MSRKTYRRLSFTIFFLWVVFIGVMIGKGISLIEERRGPQVQCITDIDCCMAAGDCEE